MISSQFLEFLSSVKEKLSEGIYQSEAAVSMMIVLPVLRHLGWPTDNPSYVCPEYPLKARKVDYGLKISEGKKKGLRCIIEVKALGHLANADRQLFEYAYEAGAPIAVLTDGKQWMIYLSIGGGELQEKLVRTFDFTKHDPEEIAKGLDRYLSFDNTYSEEARRNAERDRDKRITKDMAKKQIPVAWENLLNANSDRLINLLIEETSQSSEYPPARSDVEEFLKSLKNVESKPETYPRKRQQKDSKPEKPSKRARNEVSFFLLGEEYQNEKNVASAFVKIMEVLAMRDKNFLGKLAPEIAGKKDQKLSRNLYDLSIAGQNVARELPGGWKLSTHSSTEVKIRILRKACKIAEIPFGKPRGLKITFQSKN